MGNSLSFLKRASLTRHPTAQKLFKIMEDKQSTLCLAADLVSQKELLEYAEELGPDLCVLKTHVDILNDFTSDFGMRLRKIANKHHFLIFEDRKFADIGSTVSMQYQGGIYRIADWADLVNAHILPGPGIIEGLAGSGLLLLAEMSPSLSITPRSYSKRAAALAEAHPETVMGFICLRKISENPGMIHFTPGVRDKTGRGSLGQQYRTVEEVLIKNKSDIIIVGRDIMEAPNPKRRSAEYRKKSWEAHVEAIS